MSVRENMCTRTVLQIWYKTQHKSAVRTHVEQIIMPMNIHTCAHAFTSYAAVTHEEAARRGVANYGDTTQQTGEREIEECAR